MKRLALLSVFDKTNLVDFAQKLVHRGFSLVSTGGTARALREAGLDVLDVSDLTGFPEMMDGRVKTLHPAVHAGVLARRDNPEDCEKLSEHHLSPIDLVCVNLYPFEAVRDRGAQPEEIIENIDIGGPTLLRAASKNFRDVYVVCDPADYEGVVQALNREEALQTASCSETTVPWSREESLLNFRRYLAGKVFATTRHYDGAIAEWFANTQPQLDQPDSAPAAETLFPEKLDESWQRVQSLRYGENPHQKAAFYRSTQVSDWSLAAAHQLHGKEMSYNNIQDTNAALELLAEFDTPTVVALKHMNPCGVGVKETIDDAWQAAYEADPISIFGGIVAANRPVTLAMAEAMHELFLEIIVAPDFTPEALELLSKKKNLRLLTLGMSDPTPRHLTRLVSVTDGVLVQEKDLRQETREDCSLMTDSPVPETLWKDLLEGFRVVKHCKSNAIVLYKDGQTVGIGVGQSNRVGAARLAIEQAGDKAKGAILASDAFFPMPDTLELAVSAGISAVIQPGGSIHDQDSIDVCNQAHIPMVATGIRHFKH